MLTYETISIIVIVILTIITVYGSIKIAVHAIKEPRYKKI